MSSLTLLSLGEQRRKHLKNHISKSLSNWHGRAFTSSMTVYTMCWFNLRFCKTAKILRAPLRAFDLPIMLAAKSTVAAISIRPREGGMTHTWHESRQLPVRLISRPLLLVKRPQNTRRFWFPIRPQSIFESVDESHDTALFQKRFECVPNFPESTCQKGS